MRSPNTLQPGLHELLTPGADTAGARPDSGDIVTDTTPANLHPARGRVHALAIHAARMTASHAVRGIASGAGSAAGGWLVWWLINR